MTNRTTRGLLLIVLGLLVVFGLWVYVGERDPDDIVDFFKRGKFGFSPDAGLYKYNIASEWEHVATFHGMADDLDLCEDAAVALLTPEFPKDRYTCRLLND